MNEEIIFANPNFFWFLFIIPIMIGLYYYITWRHNKKLKLLGNTNVTKTLVIEKSNFRPAIQFSILLVAIFLLIISITRPQFISETKVEIGSGNEIIIALDISNSMMANANEIKFTRMDLAKNAILTLVKTAKNEKIGLVIFAGQAVMQIPLTQDYSALQIILKSVNPSFISAQGTAIGDAIDLAVNSFTPDKNKQKTLIVISDGEDHEGNIDNSLQLAKQKGVKIYTIGIGSNRGNVVYVDGKPLKNNDNEPVISKLNDVILRQIAKETDGEYYNYEEQKQTVNNIYNSIQKTNEKGNEKISKFDEKFHYFIFPAFLLLVLEFFILLRKNRWLAKINIFSN